MNNILHIQHILTTLGDGRDPNRSHISHSKARCSSAPHFVPPATVHTVLRRITREYITSASIGLTQKWSALNIECTGTCMASLYFVCHIHGLRPCCASSTSFGSTSTTFSDNATTAVQGPPTFNAPQTGGSDSQPCAYVRAHAFPADLRAERCNNPMSFADPLHRVCLHPRCTVFCSLCL